MAFETILTQAQIDQYTSQGYWLDRIITDYLDDVAARTPDMMAAIDPRGQITYRDLKRLSDRAALGLLELGIGPGDVVSFQHVALRGAQIVMAHDLLHLVEVYAGVQHPDTGRVAKVVRRPVGPQPAVDPGEDRPVGDIGE
jgi:non-ribosomal peptide synthetase component F